MHPHKVRLTGKILEVPREDLREVTGGGGKPWTSEPPGWEHAREHAGDNASPNAPFQNTWVPG